MAHNVSQEGSRTTSSSLSSRQCHSQIRNWVTLELGLGLWVKGNPYATLHCAVSITLRLGSIDGLGLELDKLKNVS